ncbi:hemicentin-1-like [Paramuricea clavata]|uniref:Hemicentin-1-like, partial n=1 Tax=Paramuricea clavata TaxID=317549 RepID=A0A7D9ISM0_PARCT|nr:hemicentin-1-like [Paramuricea clavata]
MNHYNSVLIYTSRAISLTEALGVFTSTAGGIKYKREYTTIEIPFTFNDNKFASVIWYYKKRGSSGSLITIYDVNPQGESIPVDSNQFTGRIEFKGDFANTNRDATLAIKDFMKQDEGNFTCEVRGPKIRRQTVTIRVTVLSNITEFKAFGNNTDEIVQGDNITLSCTTTVGEPLPIIQMRKGITVLNSCTASSISPTTLLYSFERISKDASGTYSCQVNTDGFTPTRNLQLDVKYPPEIDRSVKTEQVGCLGRLISITCEASGDPEPDVNLIGPDGIGLPIKGFVLKEFGTYRCEAFSRLGNDSRNITVSQATGISLISCNICSYIVAIYIHHYIN